MGGGRIDAKMTCSQEGGKMTMAMAGTYSPKAYDMAMESQVAGGDQAGMVMKMKVKSAHAAPAREMKTPDGPGEFASPEGAASRGRKKWGC